MARASQLLRLGNAQSSALNSKLIFDESEDPFKQPIFDKPAEPAEQAKIGESEETAPDKSEESSDPDDESEPQLDSSEFILPSSEHEQRSSSKEKGDNRGKLKREKSLYMGKRDIHCTKDDLAKHNEAYDKATNDRVPVYMGMLALKSEKASCFGLRPWTPYLIRLAPGEGVFQLWIGEKHIKKAYVKKSYQIENITFVLTDRLRRRIDVIMCRPNSPGEVEHRLDFRAMCLSSFEMWKNALAPFSAKPIPNPFEIEADEDKEVDNRLRFRSQKSRLERMM